MFKKIFNCLRNKFTTPMITYEISPKGQCFADYLVKVQSGEKYQHIQEYDNTIDQFIQACSGNKDKAMLFLNVLLVQPTRQQQND